MSQMRFNKSTDTEHEITLQPGLLNCLWKQSCAHPGDIVTAQVNTVLVGDGETVKIALENGKKNVKAKSSGVIIGDVLALDLTVPDSIKLGESIRFTVELVGNGLKGASNFIPVFLKPKLKTAKWSTNSTGRDELIELTANLDNVRDHAPVTFKIFENDPDGVHDFIIELPAMVEGGKANIEWLFSYQEDTDELPSQRELEEYGGSYQAPKYFFTVVVGDVELGLEQDSGLLEFFDSIDIKLLDHEGQPLADAKFTLHLPDGSSRSGTLDSSGRALEEKVPPGPVRIEFPDFDVVYGPESKPDTRVGPQGEDSKYTAVSGDTVSIIAKRFGVPDTRTIFDHPDNAQVKRARGNPNNIRPGDLLVLPGTRVNAPTGKTGDMCEMLVPPESQPVENPHPEWHLVCQCSHSIDGSPRVVENATVFEVVEEESKGDGPDDLIKILYRNDESPPPVKIEYTGGSVDSTGFESDGAHRRYSLPGSYSGYSGTNVFNSEFWTSFVRPYSYDVFGLKNPLKINSYYPHKWEFSLSFPSLMDDYKSGRNLAGRLKKQEEVKKKSDPAQPIVLKRDDTEISCDTLATLTPIIKYIDEFIKLLEKAQGYVPKVGWYFDLTLAVMEGKFIGAWEWREYRDHRAYTWLSLDVDLCLFSISLELGFGIHCPVAEAMLYVKISGSVKVQHTLERISPDDELEQKIGFEGEIPVEAGARVKASDIIKIVGKIESGFVAKVHVFVNTEKIPGIKGDTKFKALTGVFLYNIGPGGKYGMGETKKHKFLPDHHLGGFSWPSEEEKYSAPYLSDAEIRGVLKRVFTEGWNIRVFTVVESSFRRDERWSLDKMVAPIVKAIGSHDDLRQTHMIIESLAYRIRKRLDIIGTRPGRDWIDAERYRHFIEQGELDELLLDIKDPVAVMAKRIEQEG